jgi:hypothetical protein
MPEAQLIPSMRVLLARMCLMISAASIAVPAQAATLTIDQMCKVILQDITEYRSTRHPCPCPYSTIRSGASCGDRSTWAKPNGRAPRCYSEDVEGTYTPNRAPIRERLSPSI